MHVCEYNDQYITIKIVNNCDAIYYHVLIEPYHNIQ